MNFYLVSTKNSSFNNSMKPLLWFSQLLLLYCINTSVAQLLLNNHACSSDFCKVSFAKIKFYNLWIVLNVVVFSFVFRIIVIQLDVMYWENHVRYKIKLTMVSYSHQQLHVAVVKRV